MRVRVRMAFFTAVLFLFLLLSLGRAEVSYTFKNYEGSDLDITFSYDQAEERRIISEIGPSAAGGRVILWWLSCTKNCVLYRPFTFNQDKISFRPVLCVTRIYIFDPKAPEKGSVYRGYLFLEKGFDLTKPITITLGTKTIKATFAP